MTGYSAPTTRSIASAGRQVRRRGPRGARRPACTFCATTRRPRSWSGRANARRGRLASTSAYETDPDIFAHSVAAERAGAAGQGRAMKRITVALRAADRHGGGAAARRLRTRLGEAAAQTARRQSVGEGNQAVAEQIASQHQAVLRQQPPRPPLDRHRAQRHAARAVAADAHPPQSCARVSASSARSSSSTPAAGRARPAASAARAPTIPDSARPLDARAFTSPTSRRRPTRCRPRRSRSACAATSRSRLDRRRDLARGALAHGRQLQVGTQGYALLIDRRPQLLAHGNPNDKKRIVAPRNALTRTSARWQRPACWQTPPSADVPRDLHDTATARARSAVAAARARTRTGRSIVEQPTSDAFAVASELERQLLAAIGLALLGTVVVGWVWGRSFIQRIFALTAATRAIADGRMDERVGARRPATRSASSATPFNSMADRLVELQEDVRKQERQAMFGRIAAGLVHDLSHPIQNIGNSCKLIQKMFDDLEYRETFKRDGRARAGDHQARARRPAQHRAADSARAVPGRPQPHGRRRGRGDGAARRDRRPHARSGAHAGAGRSSRGTSSRSAASIAT